jgi:predicted ATPase
VVEQPSGTVTLLFSDVEGSTRLLHEFGPERYRDALAEHRRVLRAAFERHGGYEVDYEGDAFFVAFADAGAAVAAATEAQAALADGPVPVRMGLHTGTPILDPPKYIGADVHLAARIMSVGHGGQVLLSAATRHLLTGAVTNLGPHRLKDFDEPVAIFQLGSAHFPPLRTIANTNLPRPVSSFVGRESEVADVVELARQSRLLTLTGPGGTGKTRLAIEAAGELVPDFRGGVFWIGLASLRDPALVVETIAKTLGAREDLAAHIGDADMLLLLDNFEQVVDAAPELSRLLQACPNLRLLVTSRELLRIEGEANYAVLPLAETEAVSLFCARSQLGADDTIEELCARLDNLPLAVELAAARTRALSPAQILSRLAFRLDLLAGGRDADPRQQTLRTTIEWSYKLLRKEERRIFRALSVFAGGCTFEAAEEVAGADVDTLQSLVEKSLVRFTDERYWMLETIALLAAERLQQSGEREPVTSRFADGVAARSARGPYGRVVFPDIANWRRALEWSLESDDTELGLRLCLGAGPWRPTVSEVLHWNVRVAEELSPDRAGLGQLLAQRARAKWVKGEPANAVASAEEAIALLRESGPEYLPPALNILGIVLAKTDPQRARELSEEAHELAAASGQRGVAVEALHNSGELERDQGNFAAAQALMDRALSEAREADISTAPILHGLGDLALDRGDTADARRLYGEAFRETLRTQASMPGIVAVAGMAAVFATDGRKLEAGTFWGAAQTLAERVGHRFGAGASSAEVQRYQARLPPPDDPAFARGVEEGRVCDVSLLMEQALDSID